YLAGVVRRGLHRNHLRGHFAGEVLDRAAINLRLDVAHQDVVEQLHRVRLVNVVPVRLQFFLAQVDRADGKQGLDVRLLAHGADEQVVHQEQAVNAAVAVSVQHDLDRADQVVDVRAVAEMSRRTHHVAAEPAEELHRLGADQSQVDFDALVTPAGKFTDDRLEHADVEPAGQAAIGGYDDETDALDFALDEKRVPVIRVRVRQVSYYAANALGIGTGRLHLGLRLANLAGRNHLHRLRDLLHVFHASDLVADFLLACHVRSSSLVCIRNVARRTGSYSVRSRSRDPGIDRCRSPPCGRHDNFYADGHVSKHPFRRIP